MNLSEYTIETSSLIIRPLTISDVNIMLELSQEHGMKEWIPDQVYKDKNDAKNAISYLISQYDKPISPSDRPFVLGIETKKNNLLIGHVGLSPLKGGVEIGYAIGHQKQGKGYATEAVSTMSDWAVKNLNLLNIFGIVAADNVISCRVLEKCKYQLNEEKSMLYHGISRNVKTYEFRP